MKTMTLYLVSSFFRMKFQGSPVSLGIPSVFNMRMTFLWEMLEQFAVTPFVVPTPKCG